MEEHLKIMCSEPGEEMEEFMLLARADFISAMLRMHAANSSGIWIDDKKCQNGKIRC